MPKGTKSGAAGKFTATVNGTTVTWKLTFSHLTGPATAAHIHTGKKGVPGAVIVPWTSSSYSISRPRSLKYGSS